MKRFVAVVSCLSFAVACTTSKMVNINSDPTGARVRVAGEERGSTPLATKIPCGWSEKEIELNKEGHRTLRANLNYSVHTGNLISGLFFLVPWVWLKCPTAVYNFRLDKGVASLDGKSTLTVVDLDSPWDVHVGEQRVVAGKRLVFEPGWQNVTVKRAGLPVPAGRFLMEGDSDYVVGLVVGHSKPSVATASPN
jgi:hypothetical protein